MKKLLLLIAAFGLGMVVVNAQGTWVSQATGFPSTSTGVFNISVVDADTVWISSYDGAGTNLNYRDYSVTIDGGLTWIPGVVPAPAGHAWSMIYGLNAQVAWAVMYNAVAGAGGGIWKTVDGGVTWNQQGAGQIYSTAGVSFPNVVYFWNANEGFAMGDPVNNEFELYTTVDGGTTWTPVPGANIPNPLNASEYGIVNHFDVKGDTIWFDTNQGRVYRSIDKGLNWTVSSTGIVVPANNAIDIVFWSNNDGLARLFNGTTGAQTVKVTADGGDTWSNLIPAGNMLGSDIRYVPGTASRLVSTGANTNFVTGSSYSDDGGQTWTDIETGTQRTALGVYDINTMWAGGFTTSPTSDGIFRYELLATVACGDPSIDPGVTTAPDYTICFGDTLFLSTMGAVPPNVGATYGYAMIVSSGDISGNNDPLNQPGILGGTGVVYPAPASVPTTLINDGSVFPDGIYYFTPVVFGNATGTGSIFNLTLDPTCTYTGLSVMVTLYAAGDPNCSVGINDLENNGIAVNAFQLNQALLQVDINSNLQRNLDIRIYDVTGRLALNENVTVSAGSNSSQIDISKLNAGSYIIRIGDESSAATIKFVKY